MHRRRHRLPSIEGESDGEVMYAGEGGKRKIDANCSTPPKASLLLGVFTKWLKYIFLGLFPSIPIQHKVTIRNGINLSYVNQFTPCRMRIIIISIRNDRNFTDRIRNSRTHIIGSSIPCCIMVHFHKRIVQAIRLPIHTRVFPRIYAISPYGQSQHNRLLVLGKEFPR